MKEREGFTLAELVLSVFIFSFIAASLATIVATTNRHVFQNYRKNIVKTNVLLAMKKVQNTLSTATRVDLPLPGTAGNVLAFAVNVDKALPDGSGCYPITIAAPASWHYFCLQNGSLYYFTGNIAYNNATACGTPGAFPWAAAYAAPGGCSAGEKLVENVVPMLAGTTVFSRHSNDNVREVDIVRVLLRSRWIAANAGLGKNQRDVDFRLDTSVRFNCAK